METRDAKTSVESRQTHSLKPAEHNNVLTACIELSEHNYVSTSQT